MFGNNVTHANFSVDDVEKAKEFYTNKLGFRLSADIGGMELVFITGAGTKIHIYQKSDHQAPNATVLGIEVDDVREAVNQLKNAGIKIENIDGTDENGIMSHSDMGDAAWFRDPAGNWICVHRFNSD